jgi:hypothetical protein
MDTSEQGAFAAFAVGAAVRLLADIASVVKQKPRLRVEPPGMKRLNTATLLAAPLLLFAICSTFALLRRSPRLRVHHAVVNTPALLPEPSQRLFCNYSAKPHTGALSVKAINSTDAPLLSLTSGREALVRQDSQHEADAALQSLIKSYDIEWEGWLPVEDGHATLRIALVLAADSNGNSSAGNYNHWWDPNWLLSSVLDPTTAALSMLGQWSTSVHILSTTSLVNEIQGASKWNNQLNAFVFRPHASSTQLPFSLESLWQGDFARELSYTAYVPPPSLCPLVLDTDGSVSASVPNIGGITIVNDACLSSREQHESASEQMQLVADALTSQLRRNLGLGAVPCEGFNDGSTLTCEQDFVRGVSDWELDLLCLRLQQQACNRARSMLQGLLQLLRAQPNMKLSKQAKADGKRAAELLTEACVNNAPLTKVAEAQEANRRARRAIFDCDGVEELYLPSTQLLAVILPIMFPTLYPAVVKVVREAVRHRMRRKASSQG